MINPLYLPELREMLAEGNAEELREFCTALHPARTADFMEGLTAEESWSVLTYADMPTRVELFHYFDRPKQIQIVESTDRSQVAQLVAQLAPDDRVDLLNAVDPRVVEELLPLLPSEDRRDILHLSAYPEGTAGAVMTTQFAKLGESLTVAEALRELSRQAEQLETIYYLYIVDDQDHLRGLVTARQLVSAMGKPETTLGALMETGLVTAEVEDDQEEVAAKVARYDLLAIPVVDMQRKMLGIITYDDIIDVVREEATEDAHRSAGVEPLRERYLETKILTLGWKRGVWLAVLFGAELLTALALGHFYDTLEQWTWLVLFIPLVNASGGNMGNQSATLIITALTSGNITLADWGQVVRRELLMGLLLGTCLALSGLVAVYLVQHEARVIHNGLWVVPVAILLVMVSGALSGALLPLIFQRLGWDPALMSNPFVAGIIDILGIVIYMSIALLLLDTPPTKP
jgi:magnesium transporter